MLLPREFYTREDVVAIARELIGKWLLTRIGDEITGGIITEAEAYAGVTDRASHAWNGRRTRRTEIMYRQGGTAYVYLCYGIHSLFNIVTHGEGVPHAVLIRGIRPMIGIGTMRKRMGIGDGRAFGTGPGVVSKALGIHYRDTGLDLLGERIWLEDRGMIVQPDEILAGPRIGVAYAGDDALLPYRFRLAPGQGK